MLTIQSNRELKHDELRAALYYCERATEDMLRRERRAVWLFRFLQCWQVAIAVWMLPITNAWEGFTFLINIAGAVYADHVLQRVREFIVALTVELADTREAIKSLDEQKNAL